MKVLVTAFDPFGGLSSNSSLMTLNCLKNQIDDIKIEKLVIPTVYVECAKKAWDAAMRVSADAILSLGQAGGRKSVTVEVMGINYACAKAEDNWGRVIYGEKLFQSGENALFSTVNVKKMVDAANNAGFNAELSISAGGFVCNSLLSTLLERAKREKSDMLIGFVHLPYEVSQEKDGFSMTKKKMALCVEEMIKNIDF